ncbi:MAG TPA: dihydrolipoamide acetyltransferase family protein [Nitrososphaerales archaeon]|nr:dihydrolipoamide acetyltransferase family protein [Nitrososphaerales archaeon]
MVYEFKLPDIGEGVAEAEIIKWMVKEGEKVREDQPLVEVMTDKVNVQIPSPRTGTVSRIAVKEGETAKVGDTIMVIADDGASTPSPASTATTAERAQAPALAPSPATAQAQPQGLASATPATRKLARELGVEITTVVGTGPGGRVTDEDVRAAVSRTAAATQKPTGLPPGRPSTPGKEELVPIHGVRKTIADRMIRSKHTAAHVTHVDEVDVSELVLLREALKSTGEKRGVRLTYLPFIIKAVILALKEYPYVNSSIDEQGANIVLKKYYNIGIATDTEQGLVVPVVKDADRKDVFELAREIEQLAGKARSGQLSLDDVRGSTFTITNVGAIGGIFSTPIINLPEAAILGVHKITRRPVVREDKIEIHDMTYLSLSFDHRILDGAYAARFTSRVIEILQDSKKLLAEVL